MLSKKALIITKREYLSRIRSKWFWVGTIAIPVLLGAAMVLPSLILATSEAQLVLAMVDETGIVAESLASAGDEMGGNDQMVRLDLRLEPPAADVEAQRASLDERILADEIDAWLWISAERLEANEVEYHGHTVSNILTLQTLEQRISRIVREHRLVAAGYDATEVSQLMAGIDLRTVRVTEEGLDENAGFGDLAIALGLFMILYTTTLLYGQMVMHGVLEEKSNRIVEIVVSSVTPFDLMMGKLIGIGGACLTQLAVWIASATILTAPGVLAAMSVASDAGIPTLHPVVILNFFALFVLGYLIYASFFALVGAAFNDIKEAQQLATAGSMFVVVPMLVFMPVMNDPDSTMAVVMSLIPPFTPMIMMLRIALKMPPAWQLVLGYALTTGFAVLMVWASARVYRVGILMYGKRPTVPEIWRWMRYQ